MSSELDFILKKRNITLFLGIENQSQYFGTRLITSLFSIQSNFKETSAIVIPVKELTQDCIVSKSLVEFCGQKYKCIFIKNNQYDNFSFIFSTIKSSDVNLIEKTLSPFVSKSTCKQVVLCDIGILKKRDFVKLFNKVSKYLETYSIAVCLAAIIGYNTRGASDVETDKEEDIVTQGFYTTKDTKDSECIETHEFSFRQIKKVFNRSDIAYLCSRTKNSIESKLIEIKNEAYKTNIEELCEQGIIDKGLDSRLKYKQKISESLDFLKQIGLTNLFVFNIVAPKWEQEYNTLLNNIHITKDDKERIVKINEFIEQVKFDIRQMYKFVKNI